MEFYHVYGSTNANADTTNKGNCNSVYVRIEYKVGTTTKLTAWSPGTSYTSINMSNGMFLFSHHQGNNKTAPYQYN